MACTPCVLRGTGVCVGGMLRSPRCAALYKQTPTPCWCSRCVGFSQRWLRVERRGFRPGMDWDGEQWFITTITSFSVAALRDAMQRWDPEIGLVVGFDGVGGSLPTSCGSVILHRRCVAVASGAVEFPGGALCPKWHRWGTARSQRGRGARMAPRPPLATLALGAKSHRLKQSVGSEVGSRKHWPCSAPLHPCGQQPQDSMHGSGVQRAPPSEEPHLYRYEGQRSCPRLGMFSPHPFKLCVHSCDLWGFW